MVLSHTHIHTAIVQKFCPTKAQFEVVVNFSGEREVTKLEIFPLVLLTKNIEEDPIPPSAVSPLKWSFWLPVFHEASPSPSPYLYIPVPCMVQKSTLV